MISCEAWPRQKKEHVECNVETCADMCLWRNLCFCFTIGFFGGLRFGVCFSNAFGMPFLFSERCRFQMVSGSFANVSHVKQDSAFLPVF